VNNPTCTVWNGKPFPTQAERLVLNGRVLHDAVVWEGFCQDELGLDPDALWADLNSVPIWPDAEPIPFRPAGDSPHWITGSHPALHYRGNALGRSKIWFQANYPEGLRRYRYTGWQHAISYATHAIERAPLLLGLTDRINAGLIRSGRRPHNHFIVTRYVDHRDNIGFHSDKNADFAEESFFVVIKLGAARAFAFREQPTAASPDPAPFFNRVLPAGTAIFVRARGAGAANDLVQHGVPAMDTPLAPSGSVVSRCIETVVPWEEVGRRLEQAKKSKAAREAKKAQAALSSEAPGNERGQEATSRIGQGRFERPGLAPSPQDPLPAPPVSEADAPSRPSDAENRGHDFLCWRS
jgi:hypothetical protein